MSTFTQNIDSIMSGPISGSPLTAMREKRSKITDALDELLSEVKTERRDLKASEARDFDYGVKKANGMNETIADLEGQEARQANADRVQLESGNTGPQRDGYWQVGVSETYHRGGETVLLPRPDQLSQRGDASAADRLRRNN